MTASAKTAKKTRAKRTKKPSEVRRIARSVSGAIDDGATTVEEIHRTIAEAPLDVLDRLDVLPNTIAGVRRIQDETLTAIYDTVRKVNHEVADFTADLIEGAPRKRAPVRKSRGKARRPRTTKPAAAEAKAQAV